MRKLYLRIKQQIHPCNPQNEILLEVFPWEAQRKIYMQSTAISLSIATGAEN